MKNLLYIFPLIWFITSCSTSPMDDEFEPVILIDDNGLLTDVGMIYPDDQLAPTENADWVNGVMSHFEPIRSLTSDRSFEDLAFLEPILRGKSIVQLGESGHGVKEFNQSKTRLIKYLHEELDYDVIAFESGFFECYYTGAELINKVSSGRQLMQNSIFGVWHTTEVEELFDYINETNDTEDPLVLVGFDVQVSSSSANSRAGYLHDIVEKYDADYADQILDKDTELESKLGLRGDERSMYLEENLDHLVGYYSDLVHYLDEVIAIDTDAGVEVKMARQVAWSTMKNVALQYEYVFGESTTSVALRDAGMAENLIYLKNEIFPDEKIITWAHNFHIRHDNAVVKGSFSDGVHTMGKWVHDQFGEELYTLGLYMYTGQAATNGREVYSVSAATSGSIESIMHRTRVKYSFIDMLDLPNADDTEWVYTPISSKSWGVNPMEMVHRDQYDGILFIQEVNSPDYFR